MRGLTEESDIFMLFIESRVADVFVNQATRVALLEGLQERGLMPLIRSSRLHGFEQALLGAERVKELEALVVAQSEAEGESPYVRGDVFCFEGFAHFLVFGEVADEGPLMRAGIVYGADVVDASDRLETFCRQVQESLDNASRAAARAGGREEASPAAVVQWRGPDASAGEAFARFAESDEAKEINARVVDEAERVRAIEILEDAAARGFLRRLTEAYADGSAGETTAGGDLSDPAHEALVARLAAAGLARREVLVSCRQSGRSIFRLPSSEALAIVTASNAACSDCGAAVADERAAELVTPTPLASAMLKDGSWLLSSMRAALASAGIPETEIAARPADAQLLAGVSGEPFLFVLRDGDFNAANARRALEAEAETGAAHLAIVSTGKIQDDARARLREHARRRSRTGDEAELILAEGVEAALIELRHAAERISRRALARELYELDTSAGFNVGHMLAARFRLTQKHGPLKDLAVSAAGALAGSMGES